MADKKISQLPLIQTISGSTVVVPIVHDGTTIQMSVERLSLFTSQFSATTGSNTFIGNQTITGNTSIGGNLVVAGKLTAQEFHTEITSASIIFESGSSQFGNSGDDTHTFTGSIILNGSTIGSGQLNAQTASQDLVNRGISSVTGSMNTQSSSQDLVNRQISSTTGSINTTTSSFDSVFLRISSTTGSMNTQSSSQDLVNRQISSTTGSINTTTSSFDSVFLRISSTTGSINVQSSSQDLVNLRIASTTGSINTTTSSFDSVFLRISSTTGSINTTTSSFDSVFLGISSTTGSMNTQSSSQDLVNRGISSVTGSINTTTSSFDSVFLRISSTTGSINIQSSSQDLVNRQISLVTGSIHFVTGALNAFTGSVIGQTNTISTFTASVNFTTQSLNTQTGSQQSMNTTLSIVTGSMRAEIGGIEAYTASLKNAITVNGTNVQIVGTLDVAKLNVQYVSSSVLITSGSNVFGDQSSDKHEFTGSVNIADTLFIKGQAIGLGELNAFTGSQIGKDFTLSVVTSSIDAHMLKQATQTGSQDLVNLGISTATGSLIGITNELMALTASMKGQAIVSSSQQIKNYIEFVNNSVTSSMNVNSASIAYKATNVVGSANRILFNNATDTTTTSANLTWDGSKLAVNGNISFGYGQTLQSSLDASNNISLHDGSFGVIAIRNGGTDRITLYRTTDTIQLSGSLLVNPNNASAKHEITGGLDVSNGITGSFKGNVVGNLTGNASFATNTSNVALLKDNTDTTLYPIFSSTVAADTYSTLKGHASGTLYYNGLTQQLIVSGGGLVVTGSANTTGSVNLIGTQTITGSLLVTGSITLTSGSITMPHRPAFRIVGTGGEVIAPYVLSGSKVSVDYNQGNHFNTTNGLFTAPIAGLYQVNLVIRTNSNTNSTINQAIVYKQSSAIDTAQIMVEFAVNTTMNHSGGSTITKLEAGDTLRAQVVVGTCSFDGNNNFSVAYIG